MVNIDVDRRLIVNINWKKVILSTIEGKPNDFLPFVPRMDLWYKANKYNNTLPKKYRNCSLKEITQDIGIGYHSVVPDFRDFIEGKSQGLLALGIYDLKTNPYRIDTDSIDIKVSRVGGLTKTVIGTPYGKIHTEYLYDERMKRAGASIGHTVEHPIKGPKDFRALGYIFKNIGIGQNYSDFLKFQNFVGEDGVAVGFSMLAASPMHHIMKELMQFENFVYLFNDDLAGMEKLAEEINIFYKKNLEIVMDSTAEVIFLGANYDSFLTWPPFFKKYISPYLKKWSRAAHRNNKFLLTHADGENRGLLDEYVRSGIDVADSICPEPMTSLALKQIRDVFGHKITIWGGIPSVCVLERAMDEYSFEKYMDKTLREVGDGQNIILSFADTTPPGAKFERIQKVAGLARSYKVIK